MGILARLRRDRRNRQIVDQLWDQVVASARDPARFLEGGLPDTVEGRFEALSLEMIVVLRRCSSEPRLRDLSQDLVDRFMTDIDHSMREIGISYLAVPKRMRRFAARFYTRVRDCEPAFAEGNEAKLADALARTVLAEAVGGRPDAAPCLAPHMMRQQARYAALSVEDILAGRLLEPPEAEVA
ncbi:ubiquinol-cytochrome C chaperone family protein [Aureimonas sp. SK2]|uniref:ubiquinol-cytochrome C chaperone family protein n=1 Tax=Aureimonas sp. SK2 TaxID=3015992 RepID=UPI00244460DC|nr:ubiquinol-cytochrome C chaperone family protein [Aureimonas sp. SK2]